MTLQSSGPISLNDIQTEFGGTNPISLNEYYTGGSYVPAGTSGIPTSGEINFSAFYGKSAITQIGFWMGGSPTSYSANGASDCYTTINKISFSTEAISASAAVLTTTSSVLGTANNTLAGYRLGGINNTTALSSIDKLVFSTEVRSSLAATLSDAAAGGGGVSSLTKGYLVGGFSGITGARAGIDGINFADDTAINPAAVLSSAMGSYFSGGNDTKGFLVGGGNGTMYQNDTEVFAFIYTSETVYSPAAIVEPLWGGGTVKAATAMYAVADATSKIHKFTFSSETLSYLTTSLAGSAHPVGVSSATNGYLAGGVVNPEADPIVATNICTKFVISTETQTSHTATLPTAYSPGGGVQGTAL